MFVQTMYNIVGYGLRRPSRGGFDRRPDLRFPIFFILISLNSGLGVGINSIISRLLGAKDKEAAENAAAHGILMTVAFAGVVYLLGRPDADASLFSFWGVPGRARPFDELYDDHPVAVFFMFPAYAMNSIFSAKATPGRP